MQKKAPSQPHSHALTSHNRATLPQQHVPSRSSFCTQFSTIRARSCILSKTIVSSFPTTLTFYPRQVCNWFSGLPSSRRAGLFYYFRFQAGFFFLLLPGHNMATVDHVMVPGKLGSPENFALCGSNLFKVIKFHLLTA